MSQGKSVPKNELRLRLSYRFLLVNPATDTFEAPLAREMLPFVLDLSDADLMKWARNNVRDALWNEDVSLESVTPTGMEITIKNISSAAVASDETDSVDADVRELYPGRSGRVAALLHALEQRIDTGYDGLQWAYGVSTSASRLFGTHECTLVFQADTVTD